MRHRITMVMVVMSLLLLVTPAVAVAGKPRLLAVPGFAVRPVTIANITGDGSALLGQKKGRGGAIKWSAWTSSRADGVGKIWIDDCIPTTAEGTFHGRRVTINASRVRSGHYTRMIVRFRGGERMWEAGTILYTVRYRLSRFMSSFTWDRM